MKKKYSVHRRETHYVTFDVFFDVEAENPKNAVAIAEKHWKPGHSTDSFVSDHSCPDDGIYSATYVEGDTLAVTDKEGGHWEEGEWEEEDL